jgi:hypothetical protein
VFEWNVEYIHDQLHAPEKLLLLGYRRRRRPVPENGETPADRTEVCEPEYDEKAYPSLSIRRLLFTQ